MGVRKVSLQRSLKGSISVGPYKKGIRIRWNIDGKRPEIYVPGLLHQHFQTAHIIKETIERDLLSGNYDDTLKRYKQLLKNEVLQELIEQQHLTSARIGQIRKDQNGRTSLAPIQIDVVKEFSLYLYSKGKSDDTSYYYLTQRMLERWGDVTLQEIPARLNKENISNKTFNDRRNCLFKFFEWMVRKEKIFENPLIDVSNKRRSRKCDQRKPFTDSEAAAILQALKTDQFVKKSSRYSHAQYYPFVAFLLHTGVRNGEAIGLRVKEVNFEGKEITISHSLARTNKGTNIAARVLKGTKMENVRHLPMDDFLSGLLEPLCRGKESNAYVFLNDNGNPIDDRMFLRRVFKPIQEALKIDKRDLYACRHTFATRAVQHGMKAHEVAYLMGDSVETVLQNYFHNNRKPGYLPSPLS